MCLALGFPYAQAFSWVHYWPHHWRICCGRGANRSCWHNHCRGTGEQLDSKKLTHLKSAHQPLNPISSLDGCKKNDFFLIDSWNNGCPRGFVRDADRNDSCSWASACTCGKRDHTCETCIALFTDTYRCELHGGFGDWPLSVLIGFNRFLVLWFCFLYGYELHYRTLISFALSTFDVKNSTVQFNKFTFINIWTVQNYILYKK